MLKFVGGPTVGTAVGLTLLETVILTVLGMMSTVSIVSFIGPGLGKWINSKFGQNKKLFTKRNRRFVIIWQKYGVLGVSFLTPVLFSPILGSFLAISFGGSKKKIIGYMFASAVFWSFALAIFFHLIPILSGD
ncbi:hypothetical protein ACFLU5_12350 [Bacteroidota bacterium]